MRKKIALMTPAFGAPGGVTSVARFLFDAIRRHSKHVPTLVSVSTSAHDRASRRVLHPSTWVAGPTIVHGVCGDIKFSHVGAALAELEPARYWPHSALNAI